MKSDTIRNPPAGEALVRNSVHSSNQSKSMPSKNPWEVIKQHKSQLVFFILGILCIPVCISFFREFNDVRFWMQKEFKEPDYGWPQYSDFYITVIGCAVSWGIQVVMNNYTW